MVIDGVNQDKLKWVVKLEQQRTYRFTGNFPQNSGLEMEIKLEDLSPGGAYPKYNRLNSQFPPSQFDQAGFNEIKFTAHFLKNGNWVQMTPQTSSVDPNSHCLCSWEGDNKTLVVSLKVEGV